MLGRVNVLVEVALVRWVDQLSARETSHTIAFSHQGLVRMFSDASNNGELREF